MQDKSSVTIEIKILKNNFDFHRMLYAMNLFKLRISIFKVTIFSIIVNKIVYFFLKNQHKQTNQLLFIVIIIIITIVIMIIQFYFYFVYF